MIRFILLSLLLTSNLFSCALCSMYTPSAHVSINIDANRTTLKGAKISWKFSAEFIETLIPKYDKNQNSKFDKDELVLIEKAFIDYIKPVNFLTHIKYYARDYNGTFDDVNSSDFEIQSYVTYQKDKELFFDYNLVMNYPLEKEMLLFISVEDSGKYMDFILDRNFMNFTPPIGYKVIENTNFNMVFFEIEDENFEPIVEKNSKVLPLIKDSSSKEEVVEESKSVFILYLSNILAQTTSKIRNYLLDIKYKGDSIAFFSLMLFSFVYGIIHALGPGHGKALVSSYFLSTNRNIKKAFVISLIIGVVHTFSALILTLVAYFILNTFLSNFLNDVAFYLTKFSALIIIIIALFLLYKKLPKKSKDSSSWSIHQSSCSCHSCHDSHKKEDLALIISAGIIPCPTTVLVFIFTLSLGMYVIGLLSALIMSLGMSLVIFIAAALSVKVREKAENRFSWISNFLSFVSIAIILVLGVLMLFI